MRRTWLLILFFLTGLSSLIYEVSWVRQATLTFGVSIFAYSAVLTAYMSGVAIGSYWLGKRADRTNHPLRLFAWLQVGTAILGVLAPVVLSWMIGVYAAIVRSLDPSLTILTTLRLAMSLLALTPPAILIGASFPVISRAYARQNGRVGFDVGGLYVVNTLGSVLGCALTAIFFIRLLGLRETILLAAVINLVVAALTWWLIWQGEPSTGPRPVRKKSPSVLVKPATPPAPAGLRFVLWAYALSGFAALGYEVIWARLIAIHTIDAVYSFSIMLTIFLSGLTIGGLLGTWWLRRRAGNVLQFGVLELAIGLLAILILFVFARLPQFQLGDFVETYSVTAEILFEGFLSFITLFPVTILFGAAFPIVSSLYTTEQSEQVGFKIGRVLALNTVGSILGSLLTGFVIVPLLGLQTSVVILALINLGLGVAAVWFFAPVVNRQFRFVAVAVTIAAVIAILLLPSSIYLGYWQDTADQLIFYKEDVEATVAVFDASATNPKFSSVNGRVEVPTDALSMRAFHLLGHLPPLLNHDAQNALMLSFGNGIATGAMSTHNIPLIEVVELAPSMIEGAQYYAPENRNVLEYPGLKIHIEDARNFLLQTGQTYDLITTDATHPSNTSSWALFTAEFYRQVHQHLTPNGVFLQWVPIHSLSIADFHSILRTFQHEFPNASLWYTGGSHTLLLATPEPLTRDRLIDVLQNTPDNPAVTEDLGGPALIARHLIMDSGQFREFAGSGKLVRDNDAFFLPINAETSQLIKTIQLAAIRANPNP